MEPSDGNSFCNESDATDVKGALLLPTVFKNCTDLLSSDAPLDRDRWCALELVPFNPLNV